VWGVACAQRKQAGSGGWQVHMARTSRVGAVDILVEDFLRRMGAVRGGEGWVFLAPPCEAQDGSGGTATLH